MNTPTPTTTPRVDLYAVIHKALRLALCDTLTRLGSLDVADSGQRQAAVAQLHSLLDLCRSHVKKEDRFVHPAIEARCEGQSLRIAAEHVEHLQAIDALEAATVQFQCAPDAQRAFTLYRQLARFVAENLEHMEVEERVHNAALWVAYSDDELLQVHGAILASLEPAEMAQVLHWMLPAMNRSERLEMMLAMRATAPAPAFEATLQLARQRLPATEWAKLRQDLQADAETKLLAA